MVGIIIIFVIGYLMIAFEHVIHVNKAATALFLGIICWTLLVIQPHGHEYMHDFEHHLLNIMPLLLFLLGAMTIVELIDIHKGFGFITRRVTTHSASKLFWVIALLTFFLSAVLDNLTTTIVMIYLLRKLVRDYQLRLVFVSLVIICANAGGVWSPIGDVTTTMLWIGGQITSWPTVRDLFIPALVCALVPTAYLAWKYKGVSIAFQEEPMGQEAEDEKVHGSLRILLLGIGGLLFVPVYKSITHLMPFMGMLLSLSVLWIASEIIHKGKPKDERAKYSAANALRKIDSPSILFFVGILLAVAALESMGTLAQLASALDVWIGNKDAIAGIIGVLSAIIDNVPQVAAAMGMYPLASASVNPEAYAFAMANPTLVTEGSFAFQQTTYFLPDAKLWQAVAYTAGTGGSMLIIGSAAGVAAMGIEHINFVWYLKKIAPLAVASFVAGFTTYLLLY